MDSMNHYLKLRVPGQRDFKIIFWYDGSKILKSLTFKIIFNFTSTIISEIQNYYHLSKLKTIVLFYPALEFSNVKSPHQNGLKFLFEFKKIFQTGSWEGH